MSNNDAYYYDCEVENDHEYYQALKPKKLRKKGASEEEKIQELSLQ